MKELKVYTYKESETRKGITFQEVMLLSVNFYRRERALSVSFGLVQQQRSKLFFIGVTFNFDLISKKCGKKFYHLKRGTAFKETTKYQNVSTHE